jgi:methylated-DNA-[protein]-cysteine S-methyltransferase
MEQYRVFSTDWGPAAIVAGPRGLRGSYLPGQADGELQHRIQRDHPAARPSRTLWPELIAALRAYFQGRPSSFREARLDLSDFTEFRLRVIDACRRIPFGQTASYSDLARAAGSPEATRAVGSTMACNRFPLIVPCHRVIRADGSIGGFSSPEGVEQKRRMLELEGTESAVRFDRV